MRARPAARSAIPVTLTALLLISSLAHAKGEGAAQSTAQVPARVQVLQLASEADRIVLAWNKPEQYADVRDYKVFMNGKLLGSASDNARRHSPAQAYVDKFYAADTRKVHVRVSPHSFTVDGLKPATTYRFTVRAVLADDKLSAASPVVTARTTSSPKLCDVGARGALGDGSTLNTAAIQATIDNCAAGGTVRIPKGVFKSGALFLKSNMTLELAEGATLLGSERAEDYPLERGYKLYEYSSTQRPPSLINALDARNRHLGAFSNIRIVGKGVIDGNGWKRHSDASLTDDTGYALPQYIAGTSKSSTSDGILAAAQMEQALKEGLSALAAYSQRRSSLITLRGVSNLYVAGVTLRNPAFHGVMVLESENAAVNGVRVETWDVNNGDGVEFGNSQYVTVMNSFFDTGDDCINFAAGTGEEATSQPQQQFGWIFNNYFRRGHGAVVMGSHTGAWITDILAEDNVVHLTWTGLRGKTNNLNGGGARRVVYRDNAHRDLQREGFVLSAEYSDPNLLLDYKPASQPGKFQDILVQHNSLEFTDSWQPTPINRDGQKVVVAFNPVLVQGDAKNNVFHENIVFDDLLLINAPPIKIDGLRNGQIRGITFRDYKTEGMPWKISNAPGTKMQDVKLEPAEKK
ncbi:glycosyl hydrolase family 28 protein [Uliginosibacterium sp. H3]|uniref:Glycosyl hydrolase family 28 protein n=1 Tax=Uliginosibacterium silvisoli TaxID=3114758 RepID=A0ABU6K0C7_9RHOO|nr:glycosyl hydrolase family 28 protein [Uliginosibacterium sp. H3]